MMNQTKDLHLWLSTADSDVLQGDASLEKGSFSHLTQDVNDVHNDMITPDDSISQIGGSVRSHAQSHNSRRSRTSSIQQQRIIEEQRRLELTERVAHLKQKQELDMKMLELQLKREELQLKTDMAVANVRSNVIADIEQDMVSRTGSRRNYGSPSTTHREEKFRSNVITSTPSNRIPEFTPSFPPSFQPPYQPPTNPRNNSFNSTEDAMLTMVRELKKPQVEIKKFNGNPKDYRKFLRQFHMQIVNNTVLEDERMNFLEQFTTGDANKIVAGYSHLDANIGYPAALRELEERYADPQLMAITCMKEALEFPPIRSDDAKMLDEFAICLSECEMAVKGLEETNILQFSQNLQILLSKLPYRFHDRWRSITEGIKASHRSPSFHDLVCFVKKEARKMSDPIFGKEALQQVNQIESKKRDTKPIQGNSQQKNFQKYSNYRSKGSYATTTSEDAGNSTRFTKPNASEHNSESRKQYYTSRCLEKPCQYCNKSDHAAESCPRLGDKPFHERIEYFKRQGVCYGCLKPGHSRPNCRWRASCNICKKLHPTVLHYTTTHTTEEKSHNRNLTPDKTVVSTCMNQKGGTHMGTGDGECTMAVIPVRVKTKNGHPVITYAFLDPGSSVSFCTRSLMDRIGITGQHANITLTTMGHPYNMDTYIINQLEVYGLDCDEKVTIPTVYSTDNIPVSRREAPTQEDILKWEHLKNLKLPSEIIAHVGLLIGNAVADAYTPLETITGPSNSPHATRTRLGWVIWNLVRPPTDADRFRVNRLQVAAIQTLEEGRELDKLYRDSVNMDFPERTIDDKREPSREDRIFEDKVHSSIQMKDGHYQMALPFRNQDVKLPDNKGQAIQRLNYLEKKMNKNPNFAKDYTNFMEDIITKRYAVKIPKEKLKKDDERIWYLPHHGVYHQKKPNKIRVVFDCSAKHQGVSLNDVLLQGPDITNNLVSILLRFRQHQIAIMSDIEAMFYQVRVEDKDTDFLRFLWWPEGDSTKDYEIYKMTVHLFGAVSSPTCANTALHQTAYDNLNNFSEDITNTILNSFYVDDLLKSVPTEASAIDLVSNVTKLCHLGGFRLTKWISNSRTVLASIPKEEQAKELKSLNLDYDDLPTERALGIHWSAESDTIGFDTSIQKRPYTRRGILSTIGTIYDPLGLASPFILPARIILQELCQKNYGWDDKIPDNISQKWDKWLNFLPHLESLSIRRCIQPPDFHDTNYCELHHFSDASESGYGTASYIRFVNSDGKIHCALLFGKSRVAPLKKKTIPRLELTAATVAVRLNKFIVDNMELIFSKIYFWTDSMSVLRYIYNDTTRFQTFVANRLTIIHEGSTKDQWHYVESKTNVSDLSSRGITTNCPDKTNTWLNGPAFLWKPADEWPIKEFSSTIPDSDPETKRSTFAVKQEQPDIMDRLFDGFSSWTKLKKIVAWLLMGIDNLRRKVASKDRNMETEDVSTERISTVNAVYMEKAEKSIILYVQKKYFGDEFKALQSNQTVKKSSQIVKLDPFIKDDLIRVGGRLERSSLPANTKNPVLLPKDARISHLIIEEAHRSLGHLGKNSILSKLRENYWIVGANTSIRQIVSKCVICRRYQGRVAEQKMSSLPQDRLIADEPPFTRVGVDYFGPFDVKRGRSTLKRYGVVFTCFASRAIHLEVAFSLDTSSCINALRRFIARRGQVQVIRSDNGTNFVGTNRELKEEIGKWNQNQINDFLLQRNIQWNFNPPAASHFGGIWERQIRIIRKILFSLLKEQTIYFDDEGLNTLFCEVETIINNRPITRTSTDPNDMEPLTPNHLLILRSSYSLPPGIFDKKDNYSRRRWRQVQYIADVFWRRWSKEYLTELQERQKWIQPRRNLAVNDIVLVADNTSPRNSWLLGKVLETYPDSKSHVRSVKVKTQLSTFVRPIDKLVLILECDA